MNHPIRAGPLGSANQPECQDLLRKALARQCARNARNKGVSTFGPPRETHVLSFYMADTQIRLCWRADYVDTPLLQAQVVYGGPQEARLAPPTLGVRDVHS